MLAEWQKHKQQLRRYIRAKVKDPGIAEDILQDVYLKASTQLYQLKNKASFKSWLYRIAHNQVIDFYRKAQPYVELPDNLIVEEVESKQQLYQVLSHCVNPMLNELPEKYSVPLKWAELEGVPQKEIANKLGLSLSGAKSRVQRGRKLLQQLMLARCDFEIDNNGISGFIPKQAKDVAFCKSVNF